MTADRLRSMRRMQAVQGKMKRLAEAKLGAIETRRTAVETARRELDAFLAEATGSELAAMAFRQQVRLSAREGAIERERAAQADLLLEAHGRLRLAERKAEELGRDLRARDERQDLERLIDGLANRTAGRP